MEIIIGLAIVAVGVIWYFNAQKKKPEANNDAQAPYKVEPPKATVNAADLAGVIITPAPVVESTTPLPEEKPAKKPRAPKVGGKAAKSAKAADKAVKKAPAKMKAPAKKKTA